MYSSRSKSLISVACISVFFFVVNVFLGTGGKLLSDASIFEVDALDTDTFEVDTFEVDAFEVDAFEVDAFEVDFEVDAFLGTGVLGAGADVIFFGIFLKFSL